MNLLVLHRNKFENNRKFKYRSSKKILGNSMVIPVIFIHLNRLKIRKSKQVSNCQN